MHPWPSIRLILPCLRITIFISFRTVHRMSFVPTLVRSWVDYCMLCAFHCQSLLSQCCGTKSRPIVTYSNVEVCKYIRSNLYSTAGGWDTPVVQVLTAPSPPTPDALLLQLRCLLPVRRGCGLEMAGSAQWEIATTRVRILVMHECPVSAGKL